MAETIEPSFDDIKDSFKKTTPNEIDATHWKNLPPPRAGWDDMIPNPRKSESLKENLESLKKDLAQIEAFKKQLVESRLAYESENPPLTENKIANLEHISDPEKILAELKNLYNDYHIIVRQTAGDTVKRIMIKQEIFGFSELGLTATITSPENITRILPELDIPSCSRKFTTHKGADGMLIMAFPRSVESHLPGNGTLDRIDGFLADQYFNGKISKVGLPANSIFGYYTKGELVKNPRFGPKF